MLSRRQPVWIEAASPAASDISTTWNGLLAVLTGLAIYKPTQVNLLTTLLGGYETARTLHFTITMVFLVFFAVHLLQVARAGWSNFAAMITGYERIAKPPAQVADAAEPAPEHGRESTGV